MIQKIGVFFILTGLAIFLYVTYTSSKYSVATRTFSPYTLLSSSWEKYKSGYITKEGRVIDRSTKQEITTSEGQSYAMLRAVWIDDKETFDLAWKFTRENMKQKNSNLIGWKWGKKDNGAYGFVTEGDANSASDADQDIALALILAHRRWGDETYPYLADAKKILADLWRLNTAQAGGKRYLIAGNWARNNTQLVVNPSYFAPYAWRIFAKEDPLRNWESLIDPAYELLTKSTAEPLDKPTSAVLPPDWVAIDIASGAIKAPTDGKLTTNYSYDAQRTPWRVGVDYLWNKDPRAKAYLERLSFLKSEYTSKGLLQGGYSHDGQPIHQENPINYSTSLGYFKVVEPELAKKIYEEKIIRLYSNDKNSFNESLSYYEQNWLWFGAALYLDAINSYSS